MIESCSLEGTRIGVSVSLPPFSCPLIGQNGGFRRGEFAAAKLVVFAAAKLPFRKITGKYSPLNTIVPVPLDQSILTKEAYIIILVPLGGYILKKEYYILVPVPREL